MRGTMGTRVARVAACVRGREACAWHDGLVCELETTIAVVVPSAKVEREVAEVREEYRRSKAMTALRRRLRKDGIWSTGHEEDLRSALLTCDGDAAVAHWYLMHDASAPGW